MYIDIRSNMKTYFEGQGHVFRPACALDGTQVGWIDQDEPDFQDKVASDDVSRRITMTYKIDVERWNEKEKWDDTTGIYIRALSPDGSWESVDIALLDKESLLSWLRSRGGKNEWAENCVGAMLGHVGGS